MGGNLGARWAHLGFAERRSSKMAHHPRTDPPMTWVGSESERLEARAELLALVGPHVVADLLKRAPSSPVATYSTKEPPPDASRRLFNETCRSGIVEGAEKLGRV